MKNHPNPGKKLLRLEIKELCNERKAPLDIQYNFPALSEEFIEKAQPEEKLQLINEYLKQQKQGLKDYKKLEQKMLEKDHKKEMFLLKYNTFDGFPKHPKFFQKRIKEQEIFSNFPFQTQRFWDKKTSTSTQKKPWNYITHYSNCFDTKTNNNGENAPNKLKLAKMTDHGTDTKNLWENFTHPHENFERADVDEWDFKIKRVQKKPGVFVPNTKSAGFFDKTLKDYL